MKAKKVELIEIRWHGRGQGAVTASNILATAAYVDVYRRSSISILRCNTSMLETFSKATNLVKLESVKKAIITFFVVKHGELNVKAAEMAYRRTIIAGPPVGVHRAGPLKTEKEGLEIESFKELPVWPISKPKKSGVRRSNRNMESASSSSK